MTFEDDYRQALAEVATSRTLQVKQWVLNFRHLYLMPLALGMILGKLAADHYYPGVGQEQSWVVLCLGVAVTAATPLVIWRRRHLPVQKNLIVHTAALEKLLNDEATRNRLQAGTRLKP